MDVRFGLLTQNTFFTPKKITKGGGSQKRKVPYSFGLLSFVSCSFFLFCKRMHIRHSLPRRERGEKIIGERSKQDGRRLKGEREKRNTRGLAGEMRKGRHRREIRGRGREGGRVRRDRSRRRGRRERGRV